MTARPTIALVARDARKDEPVASARAREARLSRLKLSAAGTTGGHIARACPRRDARRLNSGPLGGDRQIGAMIAEARARGLTVFIEPLSPMPHNADVKALTRRSVVYDSPVALNRAAAELPIGVDGFARTTPASSD